MLDRSTPTFTQFDPTAIPFQARVIYDIEQRLDFSLGTHELLFSGSIGSSKSLLAAHLIMRHAIKHPRAFIGIGRRSLPDIKSTIFKTILEHIDDPLIYPHILSVAENTATVKLKNGSVIESISWADKRYKKFRSRAYSVFLFEEAVENNNDDAQAFVEVRQRVGRLPHIKENMIIYCTNPDSPSHPLYEYFFVAKSATRHVYLSRTEQNPFLPASYVEQLKKDLPPREARRMLYGEWVEINKDRVYYAYNGDLNFIQSDFKLLPGVSISLSFDFNISQGKPMSCVLSQYDVTKDTFHFFDEVVIHGSRTLDVIDELVAKGIFELPHAFQIHGDATGAARSTNSKHSNYDIIDQFMANLKTTSGLKLNYEMLVPRSNPPIRERHNIVNAYCENALGQRRLFVYDKCKMLNKGMRLTSLRKGADYIEDDNNEWQHSTTALGYRILYTINNKVKMKAGNF